MYSTLFKLIGNGEETRAAYRCAVTCGITDANDAYRIYLFNKLFPLIGTEWETWEVIDKSTEAGITNLEDIKKWYL